MAQELQYEAKVAKRRSQVELTDDELEQVTAAGGTGVRIGSDGANN